MTIAECPVLDLELDPHRFALVRADASDPIPAWAQSSPFFSVTRTADELSVLCHEAAVPATLAAQRGFRCFKIRGPLEFSAVGILDSLTGPLARARISIIALSTYDTDYLLVAEANLDAAVGVLRGAGHTVHERPGAA